MHTIFNTTGRHVDTLDILYQDDCYVAVHKPSGLFVHKSELDRRADYALRIVRDMVGQYVWPVHRLDRPTSGVLVFSLSREHASMLSAEFRNRRVRKNYMAVVRGYVDRSATIDYPLTPEPGCEAQEAVTHYRCQKTTELPHAVGRYPTARYSLVTISPVTGRRHQIRKHFAHIFHPVIGDSVHGDGKHNRFVRETFGVGRLLLAATEISFVHPVTRKQVTISAPVDDDMQGVIAQMFV